MRGSRVRRVLLVSLEAPSLTVNISTWSRHTFKIEGQQHTFVAGHCAHHPNIQDGQVDALGHQGQGGASCSCLITEEEMDEIALSSISSPYLTIQY